MSVKKDLLVGYRYTSMKIESYYDMDELKRFAKKENRKLRRERRVERYVVYPIPGTMPGMGQLFVLY